MTRELITSISAINEAQVYVIIQPYLSERDKLSGLSRERWQLNEVAEYSDAAFYVR